MPADTTVHTGSANATPPITEELAKAAEAIYKQNFELSVKNKTLSVLKSLYAITMRSLKISEIAQHIVDDIVKELAFSLATISIVDDDKKMLSVVAVSHTQEVEKVLALSGIKLSDLAIPTTTISNALVKAVSDKKRRITDHVIDLFYPKLTPESAEALAGTFGIKTVIIYPLLFNEEAFGTLSIGIGKPIDDLSIAEKETLEQLIDVVVIALERAKLHETLQQANIQLKELDRLKDEFVSVASHELRTPMTAIRGSLSTILEGYAGDISPMVREFLVASYNENDRLIRLVNNLLNISRIESGRFTFTISKIRLEDLIGEVITNLENAAKEKNLTLIYDKTGALPQVEADADKFREILINIIGNAVKFTHKGGVSVKTRLENAMIIVSIADTGSGISKEDQELLFKKFSQVQGSYAKQSGGTGLGLYICKIMVEGMGGKIWLESTLGSGSTFYFSIPIFSKIRV